VTIRARFRVGTLKLKGDTDRLDTAVKRLRGEIAFGEERKRSVERGIKRLRELLLRAVEDALTEGGHG
jgi:hypothetical protein